MAAGSSENVELMAVADAAGHDYLRRTIDALLDKCWPAISQLIERIAGFETQPRSDRSPGRKLQSGYMRSEAPTDSTKSGWAK